MRFQRLHRSGQPSGTAHVETQLPGGGKANGTFTATLIPVDTLSFAGEFNTDNQTAGCQLSVQALFLKTN
jgi:hypothetical protein